MEKDIEWLKKEVWKQDIVMDKGYIYTDDLMSIINEVDEPEVLSQELPVIPKYVADWITRYREKYDLYPALRLLENNTFVWGEIYEWYRMNTRKFVNAYLTGEYEVEEEQKYYVLDSYDIPLLERVGKQIQKTATELSIHEKARDISRFELTEQEIKSYDERFWAFAEPVE